MVAHKGHRKLFNSLQIPSVSRQAHFVSRQLHSVLHGTLSYFTAHFLSRRTVFPHGTLSFLAAHFLTSQHTFFLSRRTLLLNGTLSYFTAQYRDREIVVRILDFSQCENLKRGQENRGPLFSFGPRCPCHPCFRPGLS